MDAVTDAGTDAVTAVAPDAADAALVGGHPALGAARPAFRAQWIDGAWPAALRREWEGRRHTLGAAFASGPLMQGAMRDAYGGGPTLVLRDAGGALCGLLPLVVRPLRVGPLTLREEGFARNPHALRNDPLIDPDPVAALALLAAWRDRSRADTLRLDNLPDGPVPCALIVAARHLGLGTDGVEPGRTLLATPLATDPARLVDSLSGQLRRQIRVKRDRLAAAGTLAVEAHRGAAAIAAATPDWRALMARAWQAAEAQDPAAESRLHAALAGTGALWLLRLDGRAIASLRMIEDGDAVIVHMMHFDPDAAALSPGLVLFAEMVADAVRRGVRRLDCNGGGAFFARWAEQAKPHVSLRVYRRSLRGAGARLVRRTLAAARRDAPLALRPA